jgi:ketosteroid isomerase-like protein
VRDNPTTGSQNANLEAAVRELWDIEAIKQLKARYCYLVDERRWEELAQLWTEDAVGEYGFQAIFRGRDAIMRGFFHPLPASAFFVHMVHNPIISVRGDSASGQWYLTAQSASDAGQAMWVMGRYQDEFQRVGGEWKIKSLKFEYYYLAPYEEGWGKTRIHQPAG